MAENRETDSGLPTINLSSRFTDVARDLVGHKKTAFVIHRHFLCENSPFFKAACSAELTKTSEDIELPEDDDDIFSLWVDWAYTHYVSLGEVEGTLASEADLPNHRSTRAFYRFVRAWILADKLGDVCAANDFARTMYEYSADEGVFPPAEITSFVTQALPVDSPLYRLFFDYYVYESKPEDIRRAFEDNSIPRSFLGKVFEEKMELDSKNKDRKIGEVFNDEFIPENACRYSLHSKEHPRCMDNCQQKNDEDKDKDEEERG